MNTEKHIVYEMIEIISNHEYNNDQPVNERVMRMHLKSFRPDMIRKLYKDGVNVNDECVQITPKILSKTLNQYEFECHIPKIIRLDKNAGLAVTAEGIQIPVIDEEKYFLSKKNPFNKKGIFAKAVNDKLTVFVPDPMMCNHKNESIMKFILDKQKRITLNAILSDPSDNPNYNWEENIYPFPSEKEHELISQVLRQVFGISVQMKKDEVQNNRADKINYHEEYNVNGGQ